MAARTKDESITKAMMTYGTGFVLAIVLTLTAYFAVVNRWFDGQALIGLIMTLAVVQLLVQLVFFLHLGRRRGNWNLTAALFAGIILIVIVAGSLWIMRNMDYNMQMSPEQMNNYMRKESNKGF